MTDRSPALPDVLYVGFQKTGSTFLRGYMRQRGDLLLTRGGTALQRLGADPADAVRRSYVAAIVQSVLARPAISNLHVDMYEGLIGYVFRGETCRWRPELMMTSAPLASSDVVYDPEEFARLLVEILGPRARVLVTIRNQVDFLDSNYRHFFAHFGADYRLVQFLESIEGKLVAAAASYDRLVGALMGRFGPDRVLVMPLEEIAGDEPAAIERLCGFLGIEPKPYEGERDTNSGAGYRARGEGWLGMAMAALRMGSPPRNRSLVPPTPEETRIVRAMYAASNALLYRQVGRDLSKYGYST